MVERGCSRRKTGRFALDNVVCVAAIHRKLDHQTADERLVVGSEVSSLPV
jgi:hypothetical protein